ncbi:Fc.00g026430.m01.CDS01 [Cosmosporella sp. VM-42]
MSAPKDPLNFIPADVFYDSVPQFQKPGQVINVESSSSTDKSDPLRYAAHVSLQGIGQQPVTHCLVQFVTPQIWRVRYNPKFSNVGEYSDANSRTIVRDSFASLVDSLQEEYRDSNAWNSYPAGDTWSWKTSFEEASPDHWILSSVEYDNQNAVGTVNTRLHFLASPFRIVATRKINPMKPTPSYLKSTGVQELSTSEQVIWQTTAETFKYEGDPNIGAINNVVLNVSKPTSAAYLGFGEQGGRTVLKKPTFMNFFCYDNYNYTKVYGQGALDPKEPLYHSTPFYLEMNGTPSYRNVTGLMVDNYSQVAIDLGKTDASTIGVATRFGTFDAYIMTADNVPNMIWQYTSIVGRPKLKPRFVLGHHQGCYGYTSSATVNGIVDGYRGSGIPLDGMHLDVDFQNRYRTFTVDGIHFPDVGNFLQALKRRGVKSCTNITPILTLRESDQDQYQTLREFWDMNDKLNPATNLLVCDKRYPDGLPDNYPLCSRYDQGGYAQPSYLDPNNLDNRVSYADFIGGDVYTDKYVFKESDPNKPQGNYDSGYPFHGGVSYGTNLGTPGYYPDLNRAAARKKWGQQYQYLFDNGLEFVWQDMTTPAAANCYGDMLGFPSRLLMSDDVYDQDPKVKPPVKTAIELWGLYSYNLHKATYHGLNKLKGRENKRNFIIGRGSLTGMHRYAGLWTGDNGSSWDFWRISVAQVIALGYSGLTIAGVDMGGFTYDPARASLPPPKWCDPELLIRWYTGAFLLPWYRNHYNQHFDTKVFQEPWQYSYAFEKFGDLIPSELYSLYMSVMPICRYYVQLRYSLIQVIYDTMFGNLINGLPIARAMLITDPDDTSLFNANEDYIDTQYLLGHNILVCPVLDPGVSNRDIYLPGSDVWYPFNLRINVQNFESDPLGLKHAAQLDDPVNGGTTINYGCSIPDAINDPSQITYVTPVYIRGGAIIPQLDVRQSIDENDLNPPTLHIYPGNESTYYSMYLDDGVSRDSAPSDLPQYKYSSATDDNDTQEAKSKFREVKISQEYKSADRIITLSHPWDGYDPSSTVGDTYYLGIWAVKTTAPTTPTQVSVEFQDETGNVVKDRRLVYNYDANRAVLTVSVPVALVPSLAGPEIGVTPSAKKHIAINITGLS